MRNPVRPRPPQSHTLNKPLEAGLKALAILTKSIPVQAIPRAPPQLRNYSLGAMYAIPPRDAIDKPVAKAASAAVAMP